MVDVVEFQENVFVERVELMVFEMCQWLCNWVGKVVGKVLDLIDELVFMVELGLLLCDVVVMVVDIEDLIRVMLLVVVVFVYLIIELLVIWIIEGELEIDLVGDDVEDWLCIGLVECVDIVIVGLFICFLGEMNIFEQIWQVLLEGCDGIIDLFDGCWLEFFEELWLVVWVVGVCIWGGYLKDIKGFDLEFFVVVKIEVDNIDLQQWMVLELIWEVFEYVCILVLSLCGQVVGVYIGSFINDYSFLVVLDLMVVYLYVIIGISSLIIVNWVFYFYDFYGLLVIIDIVCLSLLVVIYQGVQVLCNGEVDVVVVGGVNVLIILMVILGFDEIGVVLVFDGWIKLFLVDVDGYICFEGGGMLVFKWVDDVCCDGDVILVVIVGSVVNYDGWFNGLIVFNQDVQVDVLCWVYKDVGIDLCIVDYIEVYGIGIIFGDLIEVEVLGWVVGRGCLVDWLVLLGVVKINVGYLELVVGVVSMVKVVLVLQYDKLLLLINFVGFSFYIDFDVMWLKMIIMFIDWL